MKSKTTARRKTNLVINLLLLAAISIILLIVVFWLLPRQNELTFAENRALVPPPPQNVQATKHENGVKITWIAAYKVTTPHSYGDKVIDYKVFRREEGQTAYIQLGVTTELFFLDTTVFGDKKYFYSVVEVHEGLQGGTVDGARSVEVSVGY